MMRKHSTTVNDLAGLNSRRPLSFLFSVGNLVVTVSIDIRPASLC